MFQTKFAKLVALVIFFLFLAVIGLYTIAVFEKNKKDYYLKVQGELLQTKYETGYKYLKVMSSDIFQMYAQNEKLLNLFSKAQDANTTQREVIRKKMYSSLVKNYKRLNNMGISQVHFHLPDNTSFLRMYRPSAHSDDLSHIRGSVVKANKTLLNQEGFEICTFMSGIRFVYPLQNTENKHIGSVEISYSAAKLLDNLKDEFIHDSHILISKTALENVFSRQHIENNYLPSWEISEYYLDTSIHKVKGSFKLYANLEKQHQNDTDFHDKILEGLESKKPFTINTIYNYQNILLTYLPLSNYHDIENISYIVTYTESDYLSNVEMEENYVRQIYLIVISLLLLFAIYVVHSQEKLKQLALYDTLTKLPNRTLFTIELQNEINRAFRYKNKIALLFLDLDGFKAVNDTYGHGIGDKLLLYIAETISSKIRTSDIASRLGGDEFTIILTDVNNPEDAKKVAQNIINTISEDIVINREIIHVGASIGISIFPENTQNAEELIKFADEMMYISKKNGKNQVTLYKNKENN